MTEGNRLTRKPPLQRIVRRFQEFVHLQSASGIVLLIVTALALVWANSPWAASYAELWQTRLSLRIGTFGLDKPLLLWINDGLMAVFFFVVGLEIKREILGGELAGWRQAALPVAAAVGGMALPALLFTLVNLGQPSIRGWGIPMATDIAFALGVLALLGDRVPTALKVFLTALAIVDDIGAVLVIALFYTEQIAWGSLALAGVVTLLLIGLNRLGVHTISAYLLLGLVLWVAVLKSGVHATIAGVVLALTIPAQSRIDLRRFVQRQQELLDELTPAREQQQLSLLNEDQMSALQAVEDTTLKAQAPLQRLEHWLHPWVAFVIMPIFALANAGVALEGDIGASLTAPLTLGIGLGLALGKPLGIALFAWLAVRSGLAALPSDVVWRQIIGVGFLGGIGFTMALFVASLAFGASPLLATAKLGILLASLLAGAVGWLLLRRPAAVAALATTPTA